MVVKQEVEVVECMPEKAERDGRAWANWGVGPVVKTTVTPEDGIDVTVGTVRVVLDGRSVGKVFLDGQQLQMVKSLTLKAAAGEVPTIVIEHLLVNRPKEK